MDVIDGLEYLLTENQLLRVGLLLTAFVAAIFVGLIGIRLMRSGIEPKPRIIYLWPKLKNPEKPTVDAMPPSRRRSYGLRPQIETNSSSGG